MLVLLSKMLCALWLKWCLGSRRPVLPPASNPITISNKFSLLLMAASSTRYVHLSYRLIILIYVLPGPGQSNQSLWDKAHLGGYPCCMVQWEESAWCRVLWVLQTYSDCHNCIGPHSGKCLLSCYSSTTLALRMSFRWNSVSKNGKQASLSRPNLMNQPSAKATEPISRVSVIGKRAIWVLWIKFARSFSTTLCKLAKSLSTIQTDSASGL